MPEEVVKIVVRQEARGTALKDAARDVDELNKRNAEALRNQSGGKVSAAVALANPDKTAEILRLRNAANAYETKGDMTAARSARLDANTIQKGLEAQTREFATAAKLATEEANKRVVLEKARTDAAKSVPAGGGGGSGGGGGVGAAVAGGLNGLGNFAGSLLGSMFGVTVAGLVSRLGQALMEPINTALERMDSANERGGERRRRQNRREWIGGEMGARGQDLASAEYGEVRDQLQEARERVGSFSDKGPGDWFRNLWNRGAGGGWYHFRTSGEAGEENNAARIRDLQKDLEKSQSQAREKFLQGPGMLAIESAERRLGGDASGARELERRIQYLKEYQRILTEIGDKDMATRGADAKVADSIRTENMAVARSISARSGTRDISQIARIAGGEFGGVNIAAQLEKIHETMRQQHQQAIDQYPHRIERGNPNFTF